MDAKGFETGDRVRTEHGVGRVVYRRFSLDGRCVAAYSVMLDEKAKMDPFYAGTIFSARSVSAEVVGE